MIFYSIGLLKLNSLEMSFLCHLCHFNVIYGIDCNSGSGSGSGSGSLSGSLSGIGFLN